MIWSGCKLPCPPILIKTVDNLGKLATPLGLMAMGAAFDAKKAFGKIKPAVTATVLKLVVWCAVFLPVAVMLGSATTVSSYVMARNMGHEGVLASSIVMLTTFFSGFTLTFWLYLLRSMGLI